MDANGQEQRARIVCVSGDAVTTSADGVSRRLTTNDIRRIEVRQSDSLLNGALVGAGAAIASGLFLCTRSEPWENCRDDVGPMLRIGAIGAGVGIGIDALIRGRRTIMDRTAARACGWRPFLAAACGSFSSPSTSDKYRRPTREDCDQRGRNRRPVARPLAAAHRPYADHN